MVNVKKVRVCVLAILIFLFFQYYISLKYSEPYPAIVYPSFEYVVNNSRYNSYNLTEIIIKFEDNEALIITDKKLFAQVRYDLRKTLLDKFFYSINKDDTNIHEYNEFKNYLLDRVMKMFPDRRTIEIKANLYNLREYYKYKPKKYRKILIKTGIVRFDS